MMIDNKLPEKHGKMNYLKKQVKDLEPGDIVLHPLYRLDGLMLINQYKLLTKDIIQKIRLQLPLDFSIIVLPEMKATDQFIKEKEFTDTKYLELLNEVVNEHKSIISTPLDLNSFLYQRINTSPIGGDDSIDYATYDNYLGDLNKSPLFLSFEKNLESQRLQERAVTVRKKLNQFIEKDSSFLDLLNQVRLYKDVLKLHSINTTSLSLMIGLTLELTDEQLLDLAIAVLLIDISLVQMPKELFNYYLRNASHQNEFYQTHINSLMKLSNEFEFVRKESILYGVLDHYEKHDGTGYPKGKQGNEISLFGRIISIVHAYDEMVGGYFYNSGTKPRDAINLIWKDKGNRFDHHIVSVVINRTNFYKIGEPIIINEYGKGFIIGFEDYINAPHLPKVKFENGMTIDLHKIEKNR